MRPGLHFGFSALLGSLLLWGCGEERFLNLGEFSPAPAFESLDFSKIEPADATDYWEVRFGFDDADPRLIGSGGQVSPDSLPDSLRVALNGTRPGSGFGGGCLPAYCYYYLRVIENGAVASVTTPEDLRQFVGSVQNEVEALLLVRAGSYYWSSEPGASGIHRVDGGFEVIALKLVSYCAPIIEKRVLLRVDEVTGAVTEVKSEEWTRDPDACI